MNDDEVLTVFRDTRALLEGHFELRSGLHSARYFQCAQALRDPAIAARLCDALAERARAELGEDAAFDGVIAPALGGIIVGYELARALRVPFIFAEKNSDGSLALRRFAIRAGERYLVAEDVVTRGGRVGETVRIVEENGAAAAAIAMLVDRSAGSVPFGRPAVSLLRMAPETFEPNACPLCAQGLPLAHPGS